MKKIYIMPALQVSEAQVYNMIAVSLKGGDADPNSEVLTKEDVKWDMWGDSEE